MVEVVARCHPALEPLLPKPVAAAAALPDWLKAMPAEAVSESLGGERVRTLKHCAPMLDALQAGILMPLAADLTVAGGELAWDWDPPPLPDQLFSRAPVGLHVPEQAAGAPLASGGRFIVKFTNYWTLAVPEGWSLLFTHPFGYPELPFSTLPGLVDCDRFTDGLVHFPALWTDPDFAGTLPAGTPVAQAIPVPRADLTLTVASMDADARAATRTMQERLQAERGVYRRTVRARRGGRSAEPLPERS